MECWIPELETIDDYNKWSQYIDHIYEIFKENFKDNIPLYCGKPVYIRKEPIEYGKEESFFHITCNDYAKNCNRSPDIRRCERIRWVRAFIENAYKCEECIEGCSGIIMWEEQYHGKTRIHIFHEDERYIVVIEKRKEYYSLVTAFYIEYDHTIDKYLKRYERNKKRPIK